MRERKKKRKGIKKTKKTKKTKKAKKAEKAEKVGKAKKAEKAEKTKKNEKRDMATSYYIHSPAAQLRLTAISALHGNIIQSELRWTLVASDEALADEQESAATASTPNRGECGSAHSATLSVVDEPIESFCETYHEAQPLITLHPGSYQINASFRNKNHSLGVMTLARQTCEDIVVLIHDNDNPDPNEAYHVDRIEVTSLTEHQRRLLERAGQNAFAIAVTPLADPYPPEQQGQGVPVHPLIGKSAQFSGMPDSQRPDPAGNEEALRKSLELQQQLNNNPNSMPSPTPTGH